MDPTTARCTACTWKYGVGRSERLVRGQVHCACMEVRAAARVPTQEVSPLSRSVGFFAEFLEKPDTSWCPPPHSPLLGSPGRENRQPWRRETELRWSPSRPTRGRQPRRAWKATRHPPKPGVLAGQLRGRVKLPAKRRQSGIIQSREWRSHADLKRRLFGELIVWTGF